jgi:hypothetical protein
MIYNFAKAKFRELDLSKLRPGDFVAPKEDWKSDYKYGGISLQKNQIIMVQSIVFHGLTQDGEIRDCVYFWDEDEIYYIPASMLNLACVPMRLPDE